MNPIRTVLKLAACLAALSVPCMAMAAEAGDANGAAAAPAAVPAADAVPAPAAATAAKSPEDVIRERFAKKVPGKVSSVTKTAFGWYEVVVENEIVYVDENVEHIFTGQVYDTRTQENITAKRSEEVLRVDFSTLPMQLAFKVVRGDGSRPVAIFEDPNCPYCKRLETDLRTLQNTTIYIFLYPILSDDSVNKSKGVWCSKDPSDAWAKLMQHGEAPQTAAADCKTPVNDVLELGHKLNVTGTPTLLFADGRRAPGMIPLARVEQMLNAAAHPGQPSAVR
jgi:thiol:disulfide interchange protein DsbC